MVLIIVGVGVGLDVGDVVAVVVVGGGDVVVGGGIWIFEEFYWINSRYFSEGDFN